MVKRPSYRDESVILKSKLADAEAKIKELQGNSDKPKKELKVLNPVKKLDSEPNSNELELESEEEEKKESEEEEKDQYKCGACYEIVDDITSEGKCPKCGVEIEGVE